ncbi:MAG: tripartite tricarboxylate transporter substrate-binding protein, partial [Xanthobacteraceae bacterium]
MSWFGAGAGFIRRLLPTQVIHFASAAFVLLATFFAVQPASAQLAANQMIRIIVPFAPAGSSDTLARLLQQPLQQALKETVIVENRAGAGTNIGTTEVARATP